MIMILIMMMPCVLMFYVRYRSLRNNYGYDLPWFGEHVAQLCLTPDSEETAALMSSERFQARVEQMRYVQGLAGLAAGRS